MTVGQSDDEIVERELPQHWMRPGERFLFGCAPVRGYVRARIGEETRLPHEPYGDMPELGLGPNKWPLPAEGVTDEDWADDPTVAFLVVAQHPGQHAVALGDHLAHSRGEALLAVSSHRMSAAYPTRLFHAPQPGEPLYRSYVDLHMGHVRGFSAPYVGRSIPPERVIRIDFADGSTLLIRDPLPDVRVQRALTRSQGRG